MFFLFIAFTLGSALAAFYNITPFIIACALIAGVCLAFSVFQTLYGLLVEEEEYSENTDRDQRG